MTSTQLSKFHCMRCEYIWVETTLCHVAISVWVAHIKSLSCPVCGAMQKNLGLVDDETRLKEVIASLLQPKTEAELAAMDRSSLMRIVRAISRLQKVSIESLVPKKSPKDLIVDTILDHFEDKGGS